MIAVPAVIGAGTYWYLGGRGMPDIQRAAAGLVTGLGLPLAPLAVVGVPISVGVGGTVALGVVGGGVLGAYAMDTFILSGVTAFERALFAVPAFTLGSIAGGIAVGEGKLGASVSSSVVSGPTN